MVLLAIFHLDYVPCVTYLLWLHMLPEQRLTWTCILQNCQVVWICSFFFFFFFFIQWTVNLSGFKNNFFLISLERKIDSTVFPAVSIILNCLQHTVVVKLIPYMEWWNNKAFFAILISWIVHSIYPPTFCCCITVFIYLAIHGIKFSPHCMSMHGTCTESRPKQGK